VSAENALGEQWEENLPSRGIGVTTAGGCGTRPFHHSGMERPTCRLSVAKVRAVHYHRHIGVGRMVHGLSHWSKGRKPLSPRVGLHYQNARDNKLTADIGARHPSPHGGAALVHATEEG